MKVFFLEFLLTPGNHGVFQPACAEIQLGSSLPSSVSSDIGLAA